SHPATWMSLPQTDTIKRRSGMGEELLMLASLVAMPRFETNIYMVMLLSCGKKPLLPTLLTMIIVPDGTVSHLEPRHPTSQSLLTGGRLHTPVLADAIY